MTSLLLGQRTLTLPLARDLPWTPGVSPSSTPEPACSNLPHFMDSKPILSGIGPGARVTLSFRSLSHSRSDCRRRQLYSNTPRIQPRSQRVSITSRLLTVNFTWLFWPLLAPRDGFPRSGQESPPAAPTSEQETGGTRPLALWPHLPPPCPSAGCPDASSEAPTHCPVYHGTSSDPGTSGRPYPAP